MTSDAMDGLIRQLLEWIGEGRVYEAVMGAWRTSCPHMQVWEEACERGFVAREGEVVRVTEAGREFAASGG